MGSANTNKKRNYQEVLETKLYINWFVVWIAGNVWERPTQETSAFYPEFDPDTEMLQRDYDKMKQALVFPNFYLDDQIGIVSLLRNDDLEITLTVLNLKDTAHDSIEFVEAKNLGELLVKFPFLQQYIKGEVLDELSDDHYHPENKTYDILSRNI